VKVRRLLLTVVMASAVTVHAEVIDRVMAVVFMQPILLSDVTAAIMLQLVPATPGAVDPLAATLDRLIGRVLMLAEVDRYQPPEPAAPEIDSRIADIERRLGSQKNLDGALAATGMTRDRLREYIRDDLRIATYLNQRFGAAAQPSDADVLAYYREHPAEFTTGGVLQPLQAVAGAIRSRLAEGHRATLIGDWLATLRKRAEVTVLYLGK
jgi:hypothetical protein